MKTFSIAEVLTKQGLFAGLRPEHIEFISGCASVVHFPKGKFMLMAGDPCTHFYLIRSGQAVVEIETANQIRVINSPGPGDLVGWSWIMAPATWRYDVRVVDDVSAIAFDADCVRKKCDDDYEFGYFVYREILKLVIERLMASRIQMLDMYA